MVSSHQDLRDYVSGLRRMVRRLSKRACEGELEALTALVELRKHVDDSITEAVTGLRHDPTYPETWENIAEAFGKSRQYVARRYGHVGGLRQAGGQPLEWR